MEATASKPPKHLELNRAMGRLTEAIGDTADIILEVQNGPEAENLPQMEKEATPKQPTLAEILRDGPERIMGLTERLTKLNSELRELLF